VLGTIAFVALRVAPGRRTRRLVLGCAAFVLCSYLVLAMPVTALWLIANLPQPHVSNTASSGPIQTLFLFDCDNRAGRILGTLDIHRRAPIDTVWLLGPDYLLEELVAAGIPAGRIRHDPSAGDTATQIAQVRERMGQPGAGTSAILASRIQMPRIAQFVQAAGIDIQLLASPLDREPASHGIWTIIPAYGALMASRDAIYELAAIAYYQPQ